MTPKPVADLFRAGRYATYGQEDNRRREMIPAEEFQSQGMGVGNTAMRVLGFQPSVIAELNEKRSAQMRVISGVNEWRTKLVQAWVLSRLGKGNDPEDIQGRIQDWNQQYPAQAINAQSLMAAMKSYRVGQMQMKQYGVAVPAKQAAMAKGYGAAYNTKD
jgi:hypothetical protein